MNIRRLGVICLAMIFLSGCASVMTENSKLVNLRTSNNQEAVVTVDRGTYTIPTVVTFVKDGEDKLIETDAEDCQKATVAHKELEGWFWGNILIGGVIGSTTDSTGDKMWTYADSVTITCG